MKQRGFKNFDKETKKALEEESGLDYYGGKTFEKLQEHISRSFSNTFRGNSSGSGSDSSSETLKISAIKRWTDA